MDKRRKLKEAKLDKKIEVLQEKVDCFLRTNTKYNQGLSIDEVEIRKLKGLTNARKKSVTKSVGRMIYDNFFTFFNVLLYCFAILVIVAGKYSQLMFLGIAAANSFIGLIQDIRARTLVAKLSIVNNMTSKVIRDGQKQEIPLEEIVIDDVIYIENGDQIPTDSVILKGNISVNESMLTGEPDNIKKRLHDTIYGGTYVTSGSAYARVVNISILNRAERIQAKASTFKKPKSDILKSIHALFKIIGVIFVTLFALSIVAIWYCWQANLDVSQTLFETNMGMVSTSSGSMTSSIISSIKPGTDYGFSTSWLTDFWNFFADPQSLRFDPPVTKFVGNMVSMLPIGMFLLTSVALSVGVITLVRKRCLVQEIYSIETLARIDTLCLDKTGTITDGTMAVYEYIKINKKIDETLVTPMISSVLAATKDKNFTATALKNKFTDDEHFAAKTVLPFSSENKFSAATLEKAGTVAIGAFGFIRIENKEETEKIVRKYSEKSYRCLLVCHSKDKIVKDTLPLKMECIGVILLEDHIRDDAPEILEWFADNNVDIKVISGDDPVTVGEIAKKAGIKNSNLSINLEGMSIEEVKKVATEYTIFGRVSPDQKEALVIALKEAGRCVGMTGDGVNDILALKRADCSIAMASGSDAAKNVSQLVLLDSNFSVLTSVVAEGRRVINNIQRASSLFLAKTFTSMVISIVSLIAMFITAKIELQFPLSINNFYVWECAFIGVGGFFLALEPNSNKIQGGFLSNALKRAVTAGACISLIITGFLILYVIDFYSISSGATYSVLTGTSKDVLNLSTSDFLASITRAFKSCCALGMTLFGAVAFYKVCSPFSKYRKIIFIGISILTVLVVGGCFLYPMENKALNLSTFGGTFFGFEFLWMNQMSTLWLVSFFLIAVIIYMFLTKISAKSHFFDKLGQKIKGDD